MPTSTNMSCHSSAQSARARAVRVEFWLQPAGLGQASWSGTSLVGRLCAMENAGMAVTLYWDQWLLYERFPLPCAVGLPGQEPACPAQPFVTQPVGPLLQKAAAGVTEDQSDVTALSIERVACLAVNIRSSTAFKLTSPYLIC